MKEETKEKQSNCQLLNVKRQLTKLLYLCSVHYWAYLHDNTTQQSMISTAQAKFQLWCVCVLDGAPISNCPLVLTSLHRQQGTIQTN